jgi:energy-coupling factor transporter ATP-binding protein EcfA2
VPAELDLLDALTLPDRYEPLTKLLGSQVANLIVAPDPNLVTKAQAFARNVYTRGEGVLIPMWGPSGAGKTTLVMNLNHWLPNDFTRTLTYAGPIDFDRLQAEVLEFERGLPANNKKIVPINFDHRENDPPSDKELAIIKRFLRQNSLKTPVVIFWPETNLNTACALAASYTNIAGSVSIDIPLEYLGPAQEAWQNIAAATMRMCNQIDHLEQLGVNPDDYDPGTFPSLGDFLRKVSSDFNEQNQRLRASIEKPLSLIIVFASETPDPGILSQLTNPSRYAFLNPQALVAVTPDSEIGRWWKERPGLLTRAIVQLNAHVVSLPPAAAISCLRNVAEDTEIFEKLGYQRQGPHQAGRDLARSDLGKLLKGDSSGRFEARGVPAEKALKAFQALTEAGFNLGKDKDLNRLMAIAIQALLQQNDIPFINVQSEANLGFCGLIPDNSIHRDNGILCIEYTWRKGDYLISARRSAVAQYILTKLQKYVRQLRWTND